MAAKDRIQKIIKQLPELTEYQLESVGKIIDQLRGPTDFWRDPHSDIISCQILQDFGDALRIHHVFSAEALSKDRFEYALERVLLARNVFAERAPRGNPGHDLTIGKSRVSLKTQADKNIKDDKVHISKFMELGKGVWTDKLEDLRGLRDRYLEHLTKYERIFTLRRLRSKQHESYELVEIPKSLLEMASTGELRVVSDSRQNPKPGYCTVKDKRGIAFNLYFDGGTERKLQVKDLRKELCTVHATWKFSRQ